jgi:hypothetical protein
MAQSLQLPQHVPLRPGSELAAKERAPMAGTNEDAVDSQGSQMDAQDGRAEHSDRSATDSEMSARTLSSDAETSPISPERRSIADRPEDTSHAPDETETTRPDGATSGDATLPTTDAFPAEGLPPAPTGPLSDVPPHVHESAAAASFEPIPTPQSPEAVAAEDERLRAQRTAREQLPSQLALQEENER